MTSALKGKLQGGVCLIVIGTEGGVLSALGNGVKGGKWFSLMDKVFARKTLAAASTKVRANKGAAGADGQSNERFAAKAEDYLAELSAALREGLLPPASRQKGSTSPRAVEERGRWAFRWSRIASSSRLSGW